MLIVMGLITRHVVMPKFLPDLAHKWQIKCDGNPDGQPQTDWGALSAKNVPW